VPIFLTMGLTAAAVHAQDTRVIVTFAPQNKNPRFDAATDEYRRIWAAEEAGSSRRWSG